MTEPEAEKLALRGISGEIAHGEPIGISLARAARANHPPQTREEFEIACLRVQYARTHLRRELELYESAIPTGLIQTGAGNA